MLLLLACGVLLGLWSSCTLCKKERNTGKGQRSIYTCTISCKFFQVLVTPLVSPVERGCCCSDQQAGTSQHGPARTEHQQHLAPFCRCTVAGYFPLSRLALRCDRQWSCVIWALRCFEVRVRAGTLAPVQNRGGKKGHIYNIEGCCDGRGERHVAGREHSCTKRWVSPNMKRNETFETHVLNALSV
jgi:hypothetical protein